MSVVILLKVEKHLHDRIIFLVGSNKFIPPLFIEVPVPSQESKRQ